MIFDTFIHPTILLHYSKQEPKGVKLYFSYSFQEEQFSIVLKKKDRKISIINIDGPEWVINHFFMLLNEVGTNETIISDIKTPMAETLKRCFELHQKNPTGFYEDYEKQTPKENV